jgi:hypothetical protein
VTCDERHQPKIVHCTAHHNLKLELLPQNRIDASKMIEDDKHSFNVNKYISSFNVEKASLLI